MKNWIKSILRRKSVEIELKGVNLDHVIAFLKAHGATHRGEDWHPDLQLDEIELRGQQICLIQETYMDPVLAGPKDFVEPLAQEITKWENQQIQPIAGKPGSG